MAQSTRLTRKATTLDPALAALVGDAFDQHHLAHRLLHGNGTFARSLADFTERCLVASGDLEELLGTGALEPIPAICAELRARAVGVGAVKIYAALHGLETACHELDLERAVRWFSRLGNEVGRVCEILPHVLLGSGVHLKS